MDTLECEVSMDHETIMRIADLTMMEWQGAADRLLSKTLPGVGDIPTPNRRIPPSELIDTMDTMIERLARFREYLNTRYGHGCGDQGHKSAVKEQNKMARKIRAALGFTYPKRDINF